MKNDPLLAELADYLESQITLRSPISARPDSFRLEPPSESLIARLFARQLALNPAAAKILAATSPRCEPIRELADIPALPVAAFRELELTTVAADDRAAVFHSSGTTGQKFSRHFHSQETLKISRLACAAWFQRGMMPDRNLQQDRVQMISLTPSPKEAPHSSLAFMIGTLMARFGRSDSAFTGYANDGGWQVDLPATVAVLRDAQAASRPIVVFGTAFSFVHLLDALKTRQESIILPPGSRIMETGGYKGRSRVLPRPELHAALASRLGVSLEHVVSEYGMSELSSQAYDRIFPWPDGERNDHDSGNSPFGNLDTKILATRRFRFPPWCAAIVVSPEDGRPRPAGQPGLLRVVDLANVASVLAIQTEDLAVLESDGFQLLGRVSGAEPRGCSLLAAEQ